MRAALAGEADAHLASLADSFERVFGVELGSGRDEFPAGWAGAEDARFPWRAVLQDGLEESLLLLAREDRLDNGARDGLGAAPWRHLGLVGSGLVDHHREAVLAVGVPAWQCLEEVVLLDKVLAATYTCSVIGKALSDISSTNAEAQSLRSSGAKSLTRPIAPGAFSSSLTCR